MRERQQYRLVPVVDEHAFLLAHLCYRSRTRIRGLDSAQRKRHLEALISHEMWVLANPGFERARLLDAYGRVVSEKEGDRDGVVWTVDALRPIIGRIDLITHNHPDGRSISEDDVATTLHLRAREVNAVTTTRRYRFFRQGDHWPDTRELVEVIIEERDRLAREMELARDRGKIDDHTIEQTFHHILWGRVAGRYASRVSYVVERRGQ